MEECGSKGNKNLGCYKQDKQRSMGCSPRSTEEEGAHRSWVRVDLTLQTSEGNNGWLGECARWHSHDILAKQQQQSRPFSIHVLRTLVELKIMDKTV